ncbi:MAG TPA: response regulator [Gemmataceae bacterium]|nr:response regulator [Gemmataceae bacterium]
MLVLSRRLHEKVVFPTINASVEVVAVKGSVVRLGIAAPPDVPVHRAEVRERRAEWGVAEPAPEGPDELARLRRLRQVARRRLEVARIGLGVLQKQLAAGRAEDAALTLGNLDEDLELLQRRLAAQTEGAPPPARKPGRKAHTALLVEDNVNERQLLAHFLRGAGLEVATAGDGTDALDYLHSRPRPDVVLLDMGLPRCDGATMVRELRGDPAYRGLKIFAVSGHDPTEYDLARGPAGIDRWFQKPIDPLELVRRVEQELGPEETCRA